MIAFFTAIAWFFKRAFWFVLDNWRVVLPIIVGILLLVLIVFAYRGCKKAPTVDLERVQKINNADEKERKKELQAIIEENQEVIKTVDNRSAITEIHVQERNAAIDEKVRQVNQKIIEAKNNGRDVTQDELTCLLTEENCP